MMIYYYIHTHAAIIIYIYVVTAISIDCCQQAPQLRERKPKGGTLLLLQSIFLILFTTTTYIHTTSRGLKETIPQTSNSTT
jgi:hypothetical protein